jgi:hypothetical protein
MLYSIGFTSVVSVLGDIFPVLMIFAAVALATTFVE